MTDSSVYFPAWIQEENLSGYAAILEDGTPIFISSDIVMATDATLTKGENIMVALESEKLELVLGFIRYSEGMLIASHIE